MHRHSVFWLLMPLLAAGIMAACQPIQPVTPADPASEAVGEAAGSDAAGDEPQAGSDRGMPMAEPAAAAADCPIRVLATGELATGNGDPLARLLASGPKCPTDVFEFRDLLLSEGVQLKTSMVANRGYHNPAFGSFSLFEMVVGNLASIDTTVESGEFFFGHFTAPSGSRLLADQDPRRGSLMAELIVWDAAKGAFNFYELRGNGTQGIWVYNGDSFDIVNDVQLLHLQADPDSPQFGRSLRCSGCHMAGGPIMKELAAPYNDWWTGERGLDFGGRTPDDGLTSIVGEQFSALVDAGDLAGGVRSGLDKLQTSEAFQSHIAAFGLQERLRPLFCPIEINLETDEFQLDGDEAAIHVPAAFFVDARLAQGVVTIDKSHYLAALEQWNAEFPEIDRRDGDRAWETPVKALSDILAVQTLIDQGIVDEEFVMDVLAVDMTNPALSRQRCGLLRLVPDAEEEWLDTFTAALAAASGENPAATVLLGFLTNPEKDAAFHRTQAEQLLATCQAQLQDAESVAELFGLLAQRRLEVRASEISMSPGGEILEPGFRVIFPEISPQPQPWASQLTTACEVVAADEQ